MSKVFVERDAGGGIKGVYTNLQPGYAEEAIVSTAPEVVAYLNPVKPQITPPLTQDIPISTPNGNKVLSFINGILVKVEDGK